MPFASARENRLFISAFCLVLVAGIFLRLPPPLFEKDGSLHALALLHPNPGFKGIGFDENLYRKYTDNLVREGLSNYPSIVDRYLEVQKPLTGAILPPTRFLYIFCAYLWHAASGDEALVSLNRVSCLFSIFLLLAAGAFAWRLGGPLKSLAVLALMSFAPTQIHMAQHALIDGFFAFWATLSLWFLWENLKQPNDSLRLALFGGSLMLMVLTKENAAFVYFGLAALVLLNRWLGFGIVTRGLLLVMLAGPLAGAVLLAFLAGGLQPLLEIYRLLVTKASALPYAIATGDGPWYRYLVELLLVSPIIFLLAWGSLFRLKFNQKDVLYLLGFVTATYILMCNIRYGMNLRYTNMWDAPLRYLAVTCLFDCTLPLRRYREVTVAIIIIFLCAIDLRQYYVLFVDHDLYELVTGGLLQALKILK